MILDVRGVGYVVYCSPRTLRAPARRRRSRPRLAIETQMREDMIRLYGFAADAERDWFRLLQGVQGVGSKVALAILGTLAPGRTRARARARRQGGRRAQPRASGPKLAARIVAELKDKGAGARRRHRAARRASARPALPGGADDAVAALVNLGYGRPQAAAAVADAVETLGAGSRRPRR